MRLFQTQLIDPASVFLMLHTFLAVGWSFIAFREVRETPYSVYAAILFPLMALSILCLYFGWMDSSLVGFINIAGFFFLNLLFIIRGIQNSKSHRFSSVQVVLGIVGLLIGMMGVLALFNSAEDSWVVNYERSLLVGYLESLLQMALAFFFIRYSRSRKVLEVDRFMVASLFYSTAGSLAGFLVILYLQ